MRHLFTLLISLTLSFGAVQASGPLMKADNPFQAFSGPEFFVNLTVYPNPSNTGIFNVQFDHDGSQELVQVKVYNLVGRQVYADQIKPNHGEYKLEVSVSSLPKGIYMLEVSQGENRMTRRLSFR